MKVNFFNKDLRKRYFEIWSAVSLILSFMLIFITIPDNCKKVYGILFAVILISSYFIMWFFANFKKSAHIKINNTNVNIIIGNIFQQNELKVIGFNDFMDTIADDRIVAKRTLHGKFLDMYSEKISDIDLLIENDELFKKNIQSENTERERGKKICYKLGSVLEYDSYILTPFTKFDENNEAYLTADEYVNFWMNFWKNIDRIYAGRTINIPLMGAGIARFRGVKPSKQELLEIMLWTLRISGFHCTYAEKSINFIIYSGDASEINFYHINKKNF